MSNKIFQPTPVYRSADPMKDFCVICDIDGTIALRTSGRSPYDMTRVSEDTAHEPVISLLRAYFKGSEGVNLVFVSGRDEAVREQTWNWLREVIYFLPPTQMRLFMRPAGDTQPDNALKVQLFHQHIEPNWNVMFVLDDRNRVVDVWRSLSLPCFQVSPGDY